MSHKHHHEKHHKASGGSMEHKPQESPEKGSDEWEEDEKDNPSRRDNADKIEDEAEEKKAGGRAKKKAGGIIKKKAGGLIKKNVGGIAGSSPAPSAARAPRKSGGCVSNPLSSAHHGTKPKKHSEEKDIS